jgi:hypothetical protein
VRVRGTCPIHGGPRRSTTNPQRQVRHRHRRMRAGVGDGLWTFGRKGRQLCVSLAAAHSHHHPQLQLLQQQVWGFRLAARHPHSPKSVSQSDNTAAHYCLCVSVCVSTRLLIGTYLLLSMEWLCLLTHVQLTLYCTESMCTDHACFAPGDGIIMQACCRHPLVPCGRLAATLSTRPPWYVAPPLCVWQFVRETPHYYITSTNH